MKNAIDNRATDLSSRGGFATQCIFDRQRSLVHIFIISPTLMMNPFADLPPRLVPAVSLDWWCQSNANQSLRLLATSLSGRHLAPFYQGG